MGERAIQSRFPGGATVPLALSVLAFLVWSCGSEGEGSGEPRCYSVEVNSTNDGTSACGPSVCQPNQHCEDIIGYCEVGCISALDCASGDYCDLTNSTDNFQGSPVGLCRTPGPSLEIPCGDGSSTRDGGTGGVDSQGSSPLECDEVQGVYDVRLDVNDSHTDCEAYFENTRCTVVQDGCDLQWSCEGENIFSNGTMDSESGYSFEYPTPMGMADCDVRFYTANWPDTLAWECSMNVMGMAVLCTGYGSQ